jgi:two-component system, OmpR family, KDP operon response regulator KdpE
MARRVLIVEDESRVRRLVERTFLGDGYEVEGAATVADGFSQLQRAEPDLVLLDVQLPDGNGVDLCRRIRTISGVPIIMLTGLHNEANVVAGLQAGADDYVTKPFRPQELLARAEANLRRRRSDLAPAEHQRIELDGGAFVLDFAARSARVGEREAPLSPREFAILGYLAQNAGRVVPHDELIQHVWGEYDSGRLVDLRTYVKLIRRNIEPDPSKPRYLTARTGTGYLVPDL